MANFANTEAGRTAAEEWAKAKIADGTWVVAHMAMNSDGNTVCRFQRFLSPTHPDYGSWEESRDDAAT